MSYKRLNIILIVDSEFRKRALELAAKISVDDQIFHIDDENYYAHITIYSPEFPENNIEKVVEEAAEIAKKTRKFELAAKGLRAEDGSIVIDLDRSKDVEKVHETVVEVLNPLREKKIREKYLSGIKKEEYSVEQADIIKKYGHPNVLKLYHPHLTLGRMASQEAAEEAQKLLGGVSELKKTQIVGIGISEMGPNGTCTNILHKFNLQ